MSLAFALGLALGAGVIVFGRGTRLADKLLVHLHLRLALLRRWLG